MTIKEFMKDHEGIIQVFMPEVQIGPKQYYIDIIKSTDQKFETILDREVIRWRKPNKVGSEKLFGVLPDYVIDEIK